MGILPVPDIFTPWQDTHPTYIPIRLSAMPTSPKKNRLFAEVGNKQQETGKKISEKIHKK
ncbi:MAG: hypothetical protein F6K17_42120 [Okeania sp. SIO3C4]|nr:hypothetical protein [Okeania sp. SIO3B3]NER08664.1 hypothetical protein [Okeania sp. SIO3C4]